MTELSDEQKNVVIAPLTPLAVIACAGSGKTETAIRRVVSMRALLGPSRGRIALLSFSNIAVDTFRAGYQKLAFDLLAGIGSRRVDIDTLDGFITSHVLRAHARRTMKALRAPFLVNGSEPFLTRFGYWEEQGGKKFQIPIAQVVAEVQDGVLTFVRAYRGKRYPLDQEKAEKLVVQMGATGAYTHELGRYWCYQALKSEQWLLRVVARRYPHIVVDESQDIGTLHQAILELLIEAGVQISLIGDPSQSIYEFAGATGEFLRAYAEREDVKPLGLTRNYRSVHSIVGVANSLSKRADSANRGCAEDPGAAFYIVYEGSELPQLLDAFHAEVDRRGISRERAAVLCRASSLVDTLNGIGNAMGKGVVEEFAKAALLRDTRARYRESFEVSARAIISLLAKPPSDLMQHVLDPRRDERWCSLRKKIWSFVRNPETGLPRTTVSAADQWLPELRTRVKALLKVIEDDCGLAAAENLGNRITKADLPSTPLCAPGDLAADGGLRIRIETVHQVKGESIEAVLYVADSAHANAMLSGVDTEVGRIGYVAATRARDLLWVAVPKTAASKLRKRLEAAGFGEIGAA